MTSPEKTTSPTRIAKVEPAGAQEASGDDDDDKPTYSAFSHRQKSVIIGLAAFAGWFSSVSSFIYFPAVPALAADLGLGLGGVGPTGGTEAVNLTITSYLVVSGLVPSVVGNAADRFGRRPVVLLALAVYLAADVGLALQSRFALLFVLRMLQSAGISGTFCITYGVLADLITPAERGGYSGAVSFFLNTPPSIGPLISGLLLLQWSWRSIFWFLAIATPCCLVPILLVFPETARNIVDDGSRRAHAARSINVLHKPVFPRFLVPKPPPMYSVSGGDAPPTSSTQAGVVTLGGQQQQEEEEDHSNNKNKKKKRATVVFNPFAALKLLRSPATALVLMAYGVGYATYSCLQASLSTLFLDIYGLSGLASGLIYLPFGIACAVSALATGRLLDRNYQKTAAEAGFTTTTTTRSSRRGKQDSDLANFPIEKARLRTITWSVVASACLVVSYGWQLQHYQHQSSPPRPQAMAGPLVTQFLVGLTLQPMFTALNTLLVDLHQDCPSTAQAACNLVRCEMAAGYLAALDALLRALGPGWTFVIFAVGLFFAAALLLLLECNGLKWRQGRLPTEAAEVDV